MSFDDRNPTSPLDRSSVAPDEQPSIAGGRVARRGRPSAERRRGPSDPRVARLAMIAVIVVGVLLTAGAIWAVVRAQSPAKAAQASGTPRAKVVVPSGPTQVFAHVGKAGIAMHFPAAADQMIAVGFHQAYNVKAAAFNPTMTMLPIFKPPAVTKAKLAADPSLKLFEEALRYRGSSPRSAADCAVRPDSKILSPVTGTVTLLKHYKLEGHIDDLQLEIRPDGAPQLRVVMIHIRDAKVKVGDRVVGGVTPVAVVRHLTLDSAVNRYLPVSPADHTHIQVNDQRYRLPSS